MYLTVDSKILGSDRGRTKIKIKGKEKKEKEGENKNNDINSWVMAGLGQAEASC